MVERNLIAHHFNRLLSIPQEFFPMLRKSGASNTLLRRKREIPNGVLQFHINWA